MTDPIDGMDMTAAEYVLGTLDAAERTAFVQTLFADPRAVAAVAAWEQRLSPLIHRAPEVEPSPALWARIAAATQAPAANDNRVARGWRGLAVAAGLVAALSSGLAVKGWRTTRHVAIDAVATLSPEGATPALLVEWHQSSRRYEVHPLALPRDPAHARQLWLIVDGAGPQSMGLVGRGARWIDGRALDPGTAATIAVSVEPVGGSPTGAPTGPVIYSGKLVEVPQHT